MSQHTQGYKNGFGPLVGGEWSDFLFTHLISAMNSPNLGWYAYGRANPVDGLSLRF
jgi:hypothetical protein